jgi:epoxyqueuosine reductase
MFSSAALKQYAHSLGFNLVGVTRAQPSSMFARYLAWLAAGMHGTMDYMGRMDRIERRADLNLVLDGVRSLVIIGLDYREHIDETLLRDPSRGRIASYAWGLDYHDVITPRLEQVAAWLRAASGQTLSHRVYVDTGALLERDHARAAGLGFTGKNTMLIHPRRGSYFFLGELLTDLEFDVYDTPHTGASCGTCTRCLRACPTDAFPHSYTLDARRCISYLTIEHKGSIDRALRPLMGNWVFGCDVCQEVCPFQRFAAPQDHDLLAFTGATERAAPPLHDLLALDDAGFEARFGGTPLARIKRARLVRNACIAAGNWADASLVPRLALLLHDTTPLVREHAAWALGRIGTAAANAALSAQMSAETDDTVRAEIARALA